VDKKRFERNSTFQQSEKGTRGMAGCKSVERKSCIRRNQCGTSTRNSSCTTVLSPCHGIYNITVRLHGPYQGSLANEDSRKHLIFPNSGILTRSQGGVTHRQLCRGGVKFHYSCRGTSTVTLLKQRGKRGGESDARTLSKIYIGLALLLPRSSDNIDNNPFQSFCSQYCSCHYLSLSWP